MVSYRVIVELIAATTTKTELTVRCELDDNLYPKGIVVSDEDMRNLNIQHADFHVADGKDAATVKEFADFLEAHGGRREAVTDASIDRGAACRSGVLEAINGNVQAAKRKAKGYRTKRNLKAIVYLIAGDVLANSPT